MSKVNFSLNKISNPSDQLARQVESLGVEPSVLLRDWYAVGSLDADGGFSVAVGDMANNIVGTSAKDAKLARELKLDDRFMFNGGLLASHCLRRWIKTRRDTGLDLVAGANAHLRRLYDTLDLTNDVQDDRATRFTGYLSHLQFSPENTVITSVGDVMVWVNGKHVAGTPEKLIDTLKAELVDVLTQLVWTAPAEDVERAILEFADKIGINPTLTEELKAQIFNAKARSTVADKQAVYKPVDDLITPWQIRNHQNRNTFGKVSPYDYGAVDGTTTPDNFIEVVTIPTEDIDQVVISTDGLKPTSDDVRSLQDLEPANREFGEQTAIELTRNMQ